MHVLSLRAGHEMMDVIETTDVTDMQHVTEGFAINSFPLRENGGKTKCLK
jgi:hypothetical protein